jgi:hypothetical protein
LRKLHDLVLVSGALGQSSFGIVREYLRNDMPVMRRMKAPPVKRHKPGKAQDFGETSGTPGAARSGAIAHSASGETQSTAA